MKSNHNTGPSVPEPSGTATPSPASSIAAPVRFRRGRVALLAVAVLALALIIGFVPRLRARHALTEQTREFAVPTVSVTAPAPGKSAAGVALPAEIRAFVEAPIYARASGYLSRWLVDIGDSVTAGKLLAEIDTPELDQELARTRADLAQAEAAQELARTTALRWAELLKTASVSEQETAEKQSDLALKTATVEGARANVKRLEELKGFARVTAPFAGTITARRTDVGQLITAGNGKELFRLAQTRTLRVFVRVPQTMARAIEPGQEAGLTLAEFPGRKFAAKIVRSAGAMEPDSRTLLTELQVDNANGEILAGSYAQVRFTDAKADAALTLPANALLFRSEGMEVGVVGLDGKVELRRVQLGRDFGQVVEVLEGIAQSDRVILNPPDSLTPGVTVQVSESPKAVAAK
jgi:membrane fusion protein, multidrug efflux system